ncbi:von Willebrand factor type A domain protein [Cooperia oncophora]
MFTTTLDPMQFLRTTKAIMTIPDITFTSQNPSPSPIFKFAIPPDENMDTNRLFASKTILGGSKPVELSPSHEGSVGVPQVLVPRTSFNRGESSRFPSPHDGAVGAPRAFATKSFQGNTPREGAVKTSRSLASAGIPRILAPVLAPLPLAPALAPALAPLPAATNSFGSTRGKCPLDILFIVDSSGSVGEIYDKQKEFLFDLLSSIEPENQSHRVGLIQFAGAKVQKTEWSFDTYREHTQLMEAFNGVRHFTGTTYIGAALELAVQLLETRRPDVLTLVVLISDGFSQDDAVRPAEVIRSMRNVEFYAVSLSQLSNREYLRQLVKDEEKLSMDKDTSNFSNRLKSRFYCGN